MNIYICKSSNVIEDELVADIYRDLYVVADWLFSIEAIPDNPESPKKVPQFADTLFGGDIVVYPITGKGSVEDGEAILELLEAGITPVVALFLSNHEPKIGTVEHLVLSMCNSVCDATFKGIREFTEFLAYCAYIGKTAAYKVDPYGWKLFIRQYSKVYAKTCISGCVSSQKID